VVYGLGVVGQLTARLCHLAGCRPVLGVEIDQERIERLPRQVGFVTINSSREAVYEKVKEITCGQMADVVFETTGNEEVIPQELKLLRTQGKMVILGSPRSLSSIDFHDQCNRNSLTIIGAHADSHPALDGPDNPWTRRKHAMLFFDLVAAGEIDVDKLITHRIPWNQAPDIYRRLLENQVARLGIILEWKKPEASWV
jgi:threonine dehydrogenase-like Zn-dependent dehydrogenase